MNKRFYTLVLLSIFLFTDSIAQISLSGKVLRHNGDPVEGVMVNCTNASSVLSGADGSFTFSDLPEGVDYTITGTYSSDVIKDITVLDLAYNSDLILSIAPDPIDYQFLAGDINFNGNLSTLDLVHMRKIILRIDDTYLNEDWVFLDGNTSSGTLAGAIVLENVTEDVIDLSLIGLVIGDPAIKTDHTPPPSNAPNTVYYFEDLSVSQGEQFSVEIKVNDFEDIVVFQQALNWDPAYMTLIDSESSTIDLTVNEDLITDGDFLVTGGALATNTNGLSLDDGSVLYTLHFNALQNINNIAEMIQYPADLIPAQTVYRGSGDKLYLLDDLYQETPTSLGSIANLSLFNCSPNPSHEAISVNVQFESREQIELALFDIAGKRIQTWNFDTDHFQKNIALDNLAQGTYVLKLRTDNGVISKKIVKY